MLKRICCFWECNFLNLLGGWLVLHLMLNWQMLKNTVVEVQLLQFVGCWQIFHLELNWHFV
jgi:hypothetical protein